MKENAEINLTHYKIDYSSCFGSGHFGIVYKLVPRPVEEKGVFSSVFPHIYDWFYPAPSQPEQDQPDGEYCIKFFYPAPLIFWRSFSHHMEASGSYFVAMQCALKTAFYAHDVKDKEQKSNAIALKYGLTTIQFFNSQARLTQIKQTVQGYTLAVYLENHSFLKPENFMLRKAFIDLLRKVSHQKLSLFDMNPENIMYDQKKEIFEIIDGEVCENNNEMIIPENNIDNILCFMDREAADERILFKLGRFAQSTQDYTNEEDSKILAKFTSPHSFFSPSSSQPVSAKKKVSSCPSLFS